MRISTAVFYAVVSCSATFILYFMLELKGLSTSSGKKHSLLSVSPEDEEAVATLERKLQVLEATIWKNRQLVVSLQANLSQMLIHQVPLLQDKLSAEKDASQEKRKRLQVREYHSS